MGSGHGELVVAPAIMCGIAALRYDRQLAEPV